MRPPSSVSIAIGKPSCSGPSRFSLGTRTFSNTTSVVDEARMPHFFSALPIEIPGSSRGTTSAEGEAFLKAEFGKWKKVIEDGNIKEN